MGFTVLKNVIVRADYEEQKGEKEQMNCLVEAILNTPRFFQEREEIVQERLKEEQNIWDEIKAIKEKLRQLSKEK